MSSYVPVDRLQFAFTLTYHYLFRILTMGIALFAEAVFLGIFLAGRGRVSARHALTTALVWWPRGMILAGVYFVFAYRMFFRRRPEQPAV
jgi:cytochrome bd-type quinol oxidase subunit 1